MDVHVRCRGRRPAGRPGVASVRGSRREDQGRLGRAHGLTRDALEGALASGMAKGAIETWDRLEAFLAES